MNYIEAATILEDHLLDLLDSLGGEGACNACMEQYYDAYIDTGVKPVPDHAEVCHNNMIEAVNVALTALRRS